MKACILVISASLALQVMAADEVLPGLPVTQAEAVSGAMPEQREEPIEEITVIGQKLISTLRQQIHLAEDHAFYIFNALNDDDDYDVHCHMVARTGTIIKKRMCLPNFYYKATADNALESLGLIGDYSNYSVPSAPVKTVLAQRFPIFKDKVKELAIKNPELLNAMQELIELTDELEQTRNTYHGTEEE